MSNKDDADIASEQEEYARIEALHRVRTADNFLVGCCNNCFEPLSDGSFCNTGCRQDFERRQAHERKMRGHL